MRFQRPAQKIARALLEPKALALEAASFHTKAAQEKTFQNLHQKIGNSELAHLTGFYQITRPEQAKHLPQTSAETLKPLFDKIRKIGVDASGIFGNSPLVAFGQTSGTTADPKRIPINREFIRSYRRTSERMTACYFHATQRWDALLLGKELALPARSRTEIANGIPVGFMSGLMFRETPRFMKPFFLPSLGIIDLPTWDEKIPLILKEARNEDVRMIAGLPPLVLAFSQAALKHYGVQRLNEVWPNLGALISGGVAITPTHRQQFQNLWGMPSEGKGIFFWEMYAATEGQFGFTLNPHHPGLAFNLFEVFFQFEEEQTRTIFQTHELEKEKKYSILVTTPGGLINYRMGDRIEILSTHPLCFRVCGRDTDEISFTGEKITAEQLEKTWQSASGKLGVPSMMSVAAYPTESTPHQIVWVLPRSLLIEYSSKYFDGLLSALDQELQIMNPSYQECRLNDFLYQSPEIQWIDDALFENYRSVGLNQGQFKEKRFFTSRRQFQEALKIS